MNKVLFMFVSLIIFTILIGIVCYIEKDSDFDMIECRNLRIERKDQTGIYVAFPYTHLNNYSNEEQYLKEYRIVIKNYHEFGFNIIFGIPPSISKVQLYQTIEVQYTINLLKQDVVFAGCSFGLSTTPFAISIKSAYSLLDPYLYAIMLLVLSFHKIFSFIQRKWKN